MASHDETTRAAHAEDLISFDAPAAVPASESAPASAETTEPRGFGAAAVTATLSASPMASVDAIRENKYRDGLNKSPSSAAGSTFATPVTAESTAAAATYAPQEAKYERKHEGGQQQKQQQQQQQKHQYQHPKSESPKRVHFVEHAAVAVSAHAHGQQKQGYAKVAEGGDERKTTGWHNGASIGWSVLWTILFIVGIVLVFLSKMYTIGEKIGAAFFMILLLALILYSTNLKAPYPDIRPPGEGGRPPCPAHDMRKKQM